MTRFAPTPINAVLAAAALAICMVPDAAFAQAEATSDFLKDGIGTNTERMPHHEGSWVALGIIVSSVLVAGALNAARPTVRSIGVVLAALGCLAVTSWFVWAYGTGFVSDPRPHVVPTDGAKPTLLWLQAAAGLAAGIILLLVASAQMKRTDKLALPDTNTPDTYGRVSRYLHWAIAVMFLSLVPMGIFMSMVPDDTSFRPGYYVAHKTIGLIILALALARLGWHFYAPRPHLDASLKPWERRSAHSAHVLLYVLMIGFPVTGFVMSTYAGKLSHFFIWDTPLFWAPSEEAIVIWGLLHKIVLPYVFFLVIGAHVLGALKHQFIDGHKGAFRRMAT
ncbi:cytochrome b [Pyruvatibacter sp.]|uniref:cytochrome b n=1 Tax=Pyruvatibacter sp. TaxID=1981328 RepID=UPI0032EF5B95